MASSLASDLNCRKAGCIGILDRKKTGTKAQSPKGTKAQGAAERVPARLPRAPEAHSRGAVLNPGSRYFLLVDDVHQLDGVRALHVHHRPLEWVFRALV